MADVGRKVISQSGNEKESVIIAVKDNNEKMKMMGFVKFLEINKKLKLSREGQKVRRSECRGGGRGGGGAGG